MPQYFDEATAQELLLRGLVDECIVYSMPCVEAHFGLSASAYNPDTWEDLRSEYLLYLTIAIQRYDPNKGSKLFTWIQNYLRYARLNWLKKEMPYTACMVQTIQGLIPLGEVEDLAITPKRRRGRPRRIMA
jgi:hypothetical protein